MNKTHTAVAAAYRHGYGRGHADAGTEGFRLETRLEDYFEGLPAYTAEAIHEAWVIEGAGAEMLYGLLTVDQKRRTSLENVQDALDGLKRLLQVPSACGDSE